MPTATETPAPVVRRGAKLKRASELDSRSVQQEQRETVQIDRLADKPEYIIKADQPLNDLDFDSIKFAEDPIKILIHRSVDPKFSPNCTDYIACNGKPAEMLFKNGWVAMGYLPRGVPFYTKRKYVEIIAKTKMTNWSTRVEEKAHASEREDPFINYTDPATSHILPFSLLEDKNPKGAEWLTLLLRQEA